jgi:hypothetical protein
MGSRDDAPTDKCSVYSDMDGNKHRWRNIGGGVLVRKSYYGPIKRKIICVKCRRTKLVS